MTLIKKLKQIERLDQLIRMKATGSPDKLANRFEVSERNIYRLINAMKSMGAPIEYCHQRCTYYYDEDVSFKFGFFGNDSRDVVGGYSDFYDLFSVLTESGRGGM